MIVLFISMLKTRLGPGGLDEEIAWDCLYFKVLVPHRLRDAAGFHQAWNNGIFFMLELR